MACFSASLTNMNRLIAIMLGRLEMDVDECISAYSEFMKAIFKAKSSRFPINLKGRAKARFDSNLLRNAIERVIAHHDASKTDLFNDGGPRGCRV